MRVPVPSLSGSILIYPGKNKLSTLSMEWGERGEVSKECHWKRDNAEAKSTLTLIILGRKPKKD